MNWSILIGMLFIFRFISFFLLFMRTRRIKFVKPKPVNSCIAPPDFPDGETADAAKDEYRKTSPKLQDDPKEDDRLMEAAEKDKPEEAKEAQNETETKTEDASKVQGENMV